jgi:hypothetical protein
MSLRFPSAAAACALMCIAACTATDAPAPEDEDMSADLEMINIDRAERLRMPQVPAVQSGRVTVMGGGDVKPEYVMDGSWPASAVRCDSAGFIQLVARGDGFGAAIVFAAPDSGDAATTYQMQDAEDGPIPSGMVRIGVQWFPEDRAYVFRGKHGTLELTRARERLTGYFTAETYETSFLDSMYVAGSFADIPIQPGDPLQCDVIPADSTAGTDR